MGVRPDAATAVIFVVGIVLAIFVFPDGWEIPVIIGFGLLEIAETTFTWRLSRSWGAKMGPETLIGARGRAITDCRPTGTVRVQGEVWQARSDAGDDADGPVGVVSREGLILVAEPVGE